MASSVSSKLSPQVFIILFWVTTGISLTSAFLRSIVVWLYRKPFSIDDALLVVACAAFLAASILAQIGYHVVFTTQRISVNPAEALSDPNLLQDVVWFQIVDYTWECLTWTTIFAIKFGFLMFFKPLVSPLPRMVVYWWTCFVLTWLAFGFCVSSVFIACPKLGTTMVTCTVGIQWQIALAMGPATISVDIATDLAIVSIPYYLLWKIKIGPKKRLGALMFLGLQTLMIIVAIIRVAGCRIANTFDIPWLMIWQHIEASLSIATMSLAAFKSFYVANRRQRSNSYLNRWSMRSETNERKGTIVVGEEEFELCKNDREIEEEKQRPTVVIQDVRDVSKKLDDDWPLRKTPNTQKHSFISL